MTSKEKPRSGEIPVVDDKPRSGEIPIVDDKPRSGEISVAPGVSPGLAMAKQSSPGGAAYSSHGCRPSGAHNGLALRNPGLTPGATVFRAYGPKANDE